MKEVLGFYGVQVDKILDTETGEISNLHIYLDHDTRAVIDYIKDFQRMYGAWQGYDLGNRLRQFEEFMHKQKENQEFETMARLHNPAVAEAYEHYRTMLALAKEYPNG